MTKSALDAEKFEHYLNSSSNRVIAKSALEICCLANNWVFIPTLQRLQSMKNNYPYLERFINFEEIETRINNLGLIDGKTPYFMGLSCFFSELEEVARALLKKFMDIPKGIEKAELLLYACAMNSGANGEVEALVYFASRDEYLVDANTISEIWLSEICRDINNGRYLIHTNADIQQKAKDNQLTLAEIYDIFDGRTLPRFFKFDDSEEEFIDTCPFRVLDWFDIPGFDPWLESFVNDFVSSSHGLDKMSLAWQLFYWCRSDLAIKKTPKSALEHFLWTLSYSELENNKPWRIFSVDFEKQTTNKDVIVLASILVFAYIRTNSSQNREVFNEAISFILQSQLRSGAWPLILSDSEGSLLSTCIAIHALALAKPTNWALAVERAHNWLLQKQQDDGSWKINGGPTTMLTVLTMDAIHLARNDSKVTFLERRMTSDQITKVSVKETELPLFSYSDEDWYKAVMPQTRTVPYDTIRERIQPQIAIVTAVEVELMAVLKKLKPYNAKKVYKVMFGYDTFYLGRFGAYPAIVVLCSNGSQGITGATLTINNLIERWNPSCVVLTGIAFGIEKDKQKVGDVLIADSLLPYEQQRIGEAVIFRNPIPQTSPELINRIRSGFGWEFLRPDKTKVGRHIGKVLTGEKLIDSDEFKGTLLEQFPEAIGGEMEGTGLWAAAERHKKPWILIKSVCDWADGQKNKNYQELAAASAVSFCEHLFSDGHTLDGMRS